ncbi:response regulator [Paenibacillus xerothermodurans]|uniref:response regulator n=1 Tax=Paenibacillus xerothermodurans TaxID=1977292 RepID=UPI001FB44314|nr:response regulator [Paenibacillus xerothermodurans]
MSKVLLIEDDQSIADMISIYLSEEDYTVVWAADGRQGKQLFATGQPDLIMLDVMLPDTNGIDLCRQLRALSSVPIKMISGKSEVSERCESTCHRCGRLLM